MESHSEMNQLKSIIEYVFQVDIHVKTQKRHHVDARMVFSKILQNEGYGPTVIAKFLKKDHATIIHYFNSINSILKFDQLLMDRYLYSKDMYLNKKETPLYVHDNNKLSNKERKQQAKIISLNNEIDKLILEKSNLMNTVSKHKRLSEIIEFIDKQTPHGQEHYVMRKINTMFNGLKFYG